MLGAEALSKPPREIITRSLASRYVFGRITLQTLGRSYAISKLAVAMTIKAAMQREGVPGLNHGRAVDEGWFFLSQSASLKAPRLNAVISFLWCKAAGPSS
jgi:hypothetical protein